MFLMLEEARGVRGVDVNPRVGPIAVVVDIRVEVGAGIIPPKEG